MARKLSLGIALIWVLWVPTISRAQAAPTPSLTTTTTTTAAPTTTAVSTVPSTTVGVPPIPDPALRFLTAGVNGQAGPSSNFTPVPVNPNAVSPSCAFEDALDACAVQW